VHIHTWQAKELVELAGVGLSRVPFGECDAGISCEILSYEEAKMLAAGYRCHIGLRR